MNWPYREGKKYISCLCAFGSHEKCGSENYAETSTTMQFPDTPTREFQSLAEHHVGECTRSSPTELRHNGKSKTTPPPSPPIKTPLRPVSTEVIPKKRANSGTGEKRIFSILSLLNLCKTTCQSWQLIQTGTVASSELHLLFCVVLVLILTVVL